MKRWINGHKLRAVWTRAGADAARSKAHPNSPIYVLEETDLECVDPPETHEQLLMRVERCMLLLTAEWLALTGRAEPPVPVVNNRALDDVRATWQRWAKPRTWLSAPDPVRDDQALHAALGRLFNERATDPVRASDLTPPEWSALFELRRRMESDPPNPPAGKMYSFNLDETRVLVAAIAKLTTQAAPKPHCCGCSSVSFFNSSGVSPDCNCQCGQNYCGCECHGMVPYG